MEEVKDKVYRQETVRPDGKLFLNCSFEDCLLSYGGEWCEWEHTRFSNCRVLLDSGANNTVQVLQGLGFKVTPPYVVWQACDDTPSVLVRRSLRIWLT
jgi:hypothetical protein